MRLKLTQLQIDRFWEVVNKNGTYETAMQTIVDSTCDRMPDECHAGHLAIYKDGQSVYVHERLKP